MKRLRWIVFTEVIALFVGPSPVWSESKSEAKIEDNFDVNWSSVTYSKTVSVHNPEVSSGTQGPQASEGLSLSCQVVIADPNLVLGISREPIIEAIADGKGADIQAALVSSRSSFSTRYEPLRYRRRYVTPPRPARWKTAVRSVLQLSQKESLRPQLVNELEPSRLQIRLDVGLTGRAGDEIGYVKGHFYVLMAESFEYVELPFEPNDNWVRLTPDVEIQIRDAWSQGSSYRLRTETRPRGGASTHSLSVESYLSDRIVVDRQFVNEKDKSTNYTGIGRLPFRVGGSHSGGGGFEGTIKKVRYKIAVNPIHQEIPFVLENIPLPRP